MSTDRFKDGYASAERHWKARWHAANDDHQKAVTENERLHARLAAVEALIRDYRRALREDEGELISCTT